uniref:Uncharacterized protein n=1 Tax=Romanomermis culicivorax TaxID=13658 RepID=A0A915JNQ5_ROMCU
MASPSNTDSALVEVQEFEEWYRQNEKDGDQLPYLERAYRHKNEGVCLDFGFLTDEKAFTIRSCSHYPKSCILSIESPLARYYNTCSAVNKVCDALYRHSILNRIVISGVEIWLKIFGMID